MPNPIRNTDAEICLIVKDLEKGWKVNHDPTIHHYKGLLAEHGVCIQEVRVLILHFPLFKLFLKIYPNLLDYASEAVTS